MNNNLDAQGHSGSETRATITKFVGQFEPLKLQFITVAIRVLFPF